MSDELPGMAAEASEGEPTQAWPGWSGRSGQILSPRPFFSKKFKDFQSLTRKSNTSSKKPLVLFRSGGFLRFFTWGLYEAGFSCSGAGFLSGTYLGLLWVILIMQGLWR